MAGLWGANARRVSQGRFRVVGCRAFRPDLEEGLGGETEETALFLPVVRKVFAQPQEPGRRERDGMLSRKKSANDAGSEIGEPNQRGKAELVHSEAGAHRLDAIVRT
jgi:hypothetical protein